VGTLKSTQDAGPSGPPPPGKRKAVLHVVRFAQGRPRLLIGLLLGMLAGLLITPAADPQTRVLVAWNVTVWSYLVLVAWLMSRASAARVRATAEREDPTAAAVLALMSLTSIASLAAIVLELTGVRDLPAGVRLAHYALTASTLGGSWLFVNAMFTFHYARLYYRAAANSRPLLFPDPGGIEPDYWDFLYFAFTIAAAAQTSDVSVVTRAMRKVVLAHTVLSFVFNVAILGMSINVAAGLIGS
jgi:uncharacterized membrane protein